MISSLTPAFCSLCFQAPISFHLAVLVTKQRNPFPFFPQDRQAFLTAHGSTSVVMGFACPLSSFPAVSPRLSLLTLWRKQSKTTQALRCCYTHVFLHWVTGRLEEFHFQLPASVTCTAFPLDYTNICLVDFPKQQKQNKPGFGHGRYHYWRTELLVVIGMMELEGI